MGAIMNVRRSKMTNNPGKGLRGQRGAALILTLLAVVVLTMIGMAMVAFTTTELRSATMYRDTLQTRALAEGGVRIVQMMFTSPTDRTLVPVFHSGGSSGSAWDYYGTDATSIETSLNAIGIYRKDRSPITPARYVGANNGFFRSPFANDWGAMFGGTYNKVAANDKYDLKFNCTNPNTNASVGTNCWLNHLNDMLLGGDFSATAGEITDISFYGPPTIDSVPYAITTVRVTATKYGDAAKTQIISREIVEAVIGDITKKPAVLGNGNVTFQINLCGDGCEQIHANGTLLIGGAASGAGEIPIGTSTSTVNGSATAPAGSQPSITPPEINPWDLSYKPTTTAGLQKYYLLAARPLDNHWNNDNPNDNISNLQTGTSGEPCGVDGLALCEDYNLEYDQGAAGTPGTARAVKPARSLTTQANMYRWDLVNNEWDFCDNTPPLSCGSGTPSFSVTPVADLVDNDFTDAAGKVDNADFPFNKTRVAKYSFEIQSAQVGATVLIDGAFYKHGNLNSTMSVIAVGSIYLHSQTTWAPALTNRVMWLSGRDIKHHSNCCAPSNTCATNLNYPANAGIIAAHEQYYADSQAAMLGILIAEHRINLDNMVDSNTTAIYNSNGDHGSLCGIPDWPWSLPTRTAIFSLKSVSE
jgi:hypothetical protein